MIALSVTLQKRWVSTCAGQSSGMVYGNMLLRARLSLIGACCNTVFARLSKAPIPV